MHEARLRPWTDSRVATMLQVGLAAGSSLLLVLGNASAQETSTTPTNTTGSPSPIGPNIVAAIVVPIVMVILLVVVAVLVFLFCVVKKKRQTEGTYRPSAEEQTGTRSVETPNTLKLPKEERLI